jgi:hypothetical protein
MGMKVSIQSVKQSGIQLQAMERCPRNPIQQHHGSVICREIEVLVFVKAVVLFSDTLQAMYDDNLLDDAGNTVTNSVVQNRLAKQHSIQD